MRDNKDKKQPLMNMMRFAFLSELKNAKADELYDRDFTMRVGIRSSQLGRSSVKCFVVMILIDMLILLLISGKGSEIEIFSNKLSVLTGSIELGLIVSSFLYVTHITYFMEAYFCDEIIRAVVFKRYPDCHPVFVSGSFSIPHYIWYVINAGSGNFVKTDLTYKVEKFVLLWVFRTLLCSLFMFHYVSVYNGATHIQSNSSFGSLITALISAVLYMTNFGGMLLAVMLYRRMKFRVSVSSGS